MPDRELTAPHEAFQPLAVRRACQYSPTVFVVGSITASTPSSPTLGFAWAGMGIGARLNGQLPHAPSIWQLTRTRGVDAYAV